MLTLVRWEKVLFKSTLNIDTSYAYFYAHFGLLHKKSLDGNAKMRINLKNVHKKLICTIEVDKLFIRKEDMCINYNWNTFTK